MPIANVAEMISRHAWQSADADTEIHQPAEMLFLIPHECERLKKIRLWALIISGVLIFTVWSNMELAATSLFRGVVMTTLLSGIAFSFYTWTSAKLERLSSIALELKTQAKNDASMRDDIQKLHQRLHERTTAKLAAEAAAQAVAANQAAAPTQTLVVRERPAPAPARTFDYQQRQKVLQLQSSLKTQIYMLGTYGKNDTNMISRCKGEIARLESELRSLGA